MFIKTRALAGAALLLLALSGCIPDEKPFEVPAPEAPVAPMPAEMGAEAPAPSPVEDLIEAVPVGKPADQPGQSKMDLSLDTQNTVNSGVEVSPLPDKKGFRVRGTYNLEGTILPSETDPESWTFSATFTFPSAGYAVQEPYANVLDTMILSAEAATLKAGSGDMIVITIPVHSPRKDEAAAQVQTEVKTSLTFKASPSAQFTAVLLAAR
ncbi:MAG: hypothetical protein HYV27_24480 [Candidatus Hydrogenedentes bacterium]|nr:hypothetical protein [Candidatus Hydrogenedentota bacterium]